MSTKIELRLIYKSNYMVEVFNGETGEVIYSLEDARTNNVWMYDNFLVLSHVRKKSNCLVMLLD
jgi:hypothetical protein